MSRDKARGLNLCCCGTTGDQCHEEHGIWYPL